MANKHKIHRTGRDRAVRDLLRHRDEVGPLDRTIYAMAAADCGYSVRQLQRQIAHHDRATTTADTAAFVVDEDVIETVFLTCGNLSGAHRRLTQSGRGLPSLSTFRRQVLDTMGGAKIAYAKDGSRRARISRVHLKRSRETRAYSYLLDHTELPLFAIPDGTRTAQRPWLTAVMDAETRYVLSWVLTFGTPTSEEVRAALMAAFTIRMPDGQTPVGGLPERAVWDRGLDFLSDLITESCLRLDVTPVALPAYSPHLKGSLERFWRFLKQDALAPLPGYIDAGRDLRGNYLLAAKALTQQALVNELNDWIEHYNTSHINRATGTTALQAWQQDHTPLREVPADQLWQDFLISATGNKVGNAGIRFRKTDYVPLHGELNDVFGRTVEVRHLPHDRSFIEVFYNGAHVATCYPADALRPDDQLSFLAARRQAEAQARAAFRTANRLRGHRDDAASITKVTGPGRKTSYEMVGPDLDLRRDGDKALAELTELVPQQQASLW